jgi:enoyl-CoA hydratase/carnithine racemase
MADFVDLESERHMRISASADTAEAFRAFVEKRPPVFTD